MRIVIPGGSGQVGNILARSFHGKGHDVVVLTRGEVLAPWRSVSWNAVDPGPWVGELDGADVVVNLAGRSVNCRYDRENRERILRSRVDATRAIGRALSSVERPPPLWLQASTATIYAHRHDAPNDEATGIIGEGEPGAKEAWRFSIEVATAWERAADEIDLPRTRVVKMRSAMTMSPDPGGVFDTLLALVRFGLGGRAGDGRQFVSWIHDADFVRAVQWLIEHDDVAGAVNLAAPNPLPNDEFMKALRRSWGRSIGLPASAWMLEVGARLLRTETELVLKSRRVVPGRLLAAGFTFDHPTWPEAAEELCARWRRDRSMAAMSR